MSENDARLADAEEKLARIIERARSLGVNIDANITEAARLGEPGEDVQAVHIPGIERTNPSDPSTKGNGATVLRLIFALADQYGIDVEIEHMADEPKLGAYYAALGFIAEDAPGPIVNMRRLPRRLTEQDQLSPESVAA